MSVFGAKECIAAIEGLKTKAGESAMTIVKRSEVVLEGEIKKSFTLSHPKGTPTPASPGAPPAVVTGTLRRSVRSTVPQPLAGGGASGKVYPTAIYARRQELGGGGVPSRPYVGPSYQKSIDSFARIAEEEWRLGTRA